MASYPDVPIQLATELASQLATPSLYLSSIPRQSLRLLSHVLVESESVGSMVALAVAF